jgi:acetyl-CoA carboxylase biotin carboxyl carrier protein
MDLDEIKALIEAMQASDLTEMEVSRNGWTLRMVRHGNGATPAPRPPKERPETPACEPSHTLAGVPQDTAPDRTEIRTPLSGIVHLAASPGAPPWVQPGQAVAAGTTLCTIEAMKVFTSVRAEWDGTVEAVLVADKTEVEAGQALMRIQASEPCSTPS